ncbi:hypothetical protein C8R46DRAFT_1065751 [Mycena filopes]|nr:hypothetical protein C8R46DRAFT_1065751 [Mycena filopes]
MRPLGGMESNRAKGRRVLAAFGCVRWVCRTPASAVAIGARRNGGEVIFYPLLPKRIGAARSVVGGRHIERRGWRERAERRSGEAGTGNWHVEVHRDAEVVDRDGKEGERFRGSNSYASAAEREELLDVEIPWPLRNPESKNHGAAERISPRSNIREVARRTISLDDEIRLHLDISPRPAADNVDRACEVVQVEMLPTPGRAKLKNKSHWKGWMVRCARVEEERAF